MKNRTFTLLLLLCCLVSPLGSVFSQVCTIDSSHSSPGIYPIDTLPDMVKDSAYEAVIQFVFPIDTTLFGFTMNFDSFIVLNVPPIQGLLWQCDRYLDSCHYITQPPQLTRGCVKLYGTPTQVNPAYPGYDSILVAGQAWVTVPFLGPTPVDIDIPIHYRIADSVVGIDDAQPSDLRMAIHPNPATTKATLAYSLREPAQVTVEIYDMLGQRQAALPPRKHSAGEQQVSLPLHGLPAGLYFVKVDIGRGHYDVEKFLKVDW